MAKRTRIRRPAPARTAPIRDFSTVLLDDVPEEPQGAAATQPAGEQPSSDLFTDAVAQGARLGYTVIQEQIRQGRLIAQQWAGANGRSSGGDADLNHLLQRMVHLSTDLGALLVDFTGVLMRNPASRGGLRNGASVNGSAAVSPDEGKVTVEIEARGRSKVMLDLGIAAADGHLHVPALYALDGGTPLTQVAFEGHALRIKVPDEQPPGIYSGVVVDGRTNEPRGTLSVQLSR